MLYPLITLSQASFFLTSSSSSSSSSSMKRMVLILFVALSSQVSSSTPLSTRLSRAPQRARLSEPEHKHRFLVLFYTYFSVFGSNTFSYLVVVQKKSAGKFNAFIFQFIFQWEATVRDHCFKSSLSHRLTEKQTPLTRPVQQWPDLQHIQTYQLFRESDFILIGQIKTHESLWNRHLFHFRKRGKPDLI